MRVGQFKHGCDLNQTFVQKLQLREALDFSAYRKKSRIRTPSAREVFAQSQDPYVRVAENNYRLAQTADPVSRRACCVWCTRYLDQPTVQGSDHLCFLGSPSCTGATETTWYGFPVPWSFTGQSKFLGGNCLIQLLGPFSGVVAGAFLLDVLIYMAMYYGSVLAYLGIRSVVSTRMRSSSLP